MLDTRFRPNLQQWFVDPVARFLADHTFLKPNQITLISGLLGILAAALIVSKLSVLAVIIIWVSGYLDVLDGTLARVTESSTEVGAVLDIMVDRLVEFSVIVGIFLVDPVHRGLWSILMLGSVLICVTSFLVVGIFAKNETAKSFHYSPGLMERAEAFLFFSVMILFPKSFVPMAIAFASLVMFTAWSRTYQFICQASRVGS